MRTFFTSLITDAIQRGELAADIDITPVVEMLVAILWGVACYAGSTDSDDDMLLIAKQLDRLFAHGLLPPGQRRTKSLTIHPHAPAGDAVDGFASTWPGLRLTFYQPPEQPIVSGDGVEPVVVRGDFTRERVRDLLYRSYGVDSFVDGLGHYDTLDAAARIE